MGWRKLKDVRKGYIEKTEKDLEDKGVEEVWEGAAGDATWCGKRDRGRDRGS